MSREKDVPQALRNQVVGMRVGGASFPKIEEELGVPADTARQIYNRYLKQGDTENAPRSGAPKKLTDTVLRYINRHIRHDRETWR